MWAVQNNETNDAAVYNLNEKQCLQLNNDYNGILNVLKLILLCTFPSSLVLQSIAQLPAYNDMVFDRKIIYMFV